MSVVRCFSSGSGRLIAMVAIICTVLPRPISSLRHEPAPGEQYDHRNVRQNPAFMWTDTFLIHHPAFRESASRACKGDIPSNSNYLMRKQAYLEPWKQVSLTRRTSGCSQLNTAM